MRNAIGIAARRNRFFSILAGLAFAAVASGALAQARPVDREAREVRALFDAGKFDELDAIETKSRDLSVTLSDGQPLRVGYFVGLTCACGDVTREDQFNTIARMKPAYQAWSKANPDSRTAKLGPALYLLQHGLAFRGETYSQDVPRPDWIAFQEKIEASRKALDSIAAEMKDEPMWHATRLKVARYLPRGDKAAYEALLEEAMMRHPRFLPIYFEGAAHYSPTWGGSPAQLKGYIESAAARTKPLMGDVMYARLNWSTSSTGMFFNGQADWKRMKPALDELVKDYPDDWNLNNFAIFSCHAGDGPTLKILLERIRGRIVLEAWDGMQEYGRCAKFAEQAGG
jgi:hypothetical protein